MSTNSTPYFLFLKIPTCLIPFKKAVGNLSKTILWTTLVLWNILQSAINLSNDLFVSVMFLHFLVFGVVQNLNQRETFDKSMENNPKEVKNVSAENASIPLCHHPHYCHHCCHNNSTTATSPSLPLLRLLTLPQSPLLCQQKILMIFHTSHLNENVLGSPHFDIYAGWSLFNVFTLS